MSKIGKLITLFIGAFFECFDRGELSDLNFSKESESKPYFDNVRDFKNSDCSCISVESLSKNRILDLHIFEWILTAFNKYLSRISTQELSVKLSQFDESVSDDYFLRVTDNVPANDNKLAVDLFKIIWDSIFARISCYEKTISYATSLHNESANNLKDKYDGLIVSVNNASASVNSIFEKVNGKDGEDGLEKKVDNVRDSIQNTTVTILGIFAAIVLAFAGVFSFSSSIMQNINTTSIYRLLGITTIIGIVSFNIIFCLIIYLLRGSKISKGAFSTVKFYFPIILTDFILLVIFSLTVASWYFGWQKKTPQQDSVSSPSESYSDTVVSSESDAFFKHFS